MHVQTHDQDSHPGFDGVKIKCYFIIMLKKATDQVLGAVTDVVPLGAVEGILPLHDGPQHVDLLPVPERGTPHQSETNRPCLIQRNLLGEHVAWEKLLNFNCRDSDL